MSELKIQCFNSSTSSYQLSKKLLSEFELSPALKQREHEIQFIEQTCKNVGKSKTVLYVLTLNDQKLGLIAISVTSIAELPSVQIDYIFTDYRFRGKKLDETDNSSRVSDHLIDFVIQYTINMKESIGVKYIVLLPDNDKLIERYQESGFNILNISHIREKWMYLKLD